MKKVWNKKNICLTAVAAVLVMAVSVQSALAYFTTYTVVEGTEPLELGFTKTVVEESYQDGEKTVVIKNQGTASCYVRVKAIVAAKYADKVEYKEPAGNANWEKKDGFYEYKEVLEPGQSTTELYIALNKILVTPGETTDDLNVIVIQECAPVLYDKVGDTYADWSGETFNIEKVEKE